MANIKDLIKSIEAADSSFDEKLAAINQMEETLVAMRQQEEQAVQDNVDLIVEAIKVMERKVESQLEIAKSIVPEKGDKGDKGERGLDGKNGLDGKDGRDGINGRDGQDGQDGVSVTDAKIDFDGSLIITLSTGQEINVGEVVAPELQEKIKLVTSGGAGTVLPEQAGNANKYLKTSGTTLSWDTLDGSDINLASPPTIGNTTPNTGAFTTLSASSTVSGAGFSTYLASPPAIGGTTPAAGTFTTLTAQTEVLKGTGQNYFINSNNFSTGWSPTNATVSTASAITDPFGGTSTWNLTEDSTTNSHYITKAFTAFIGSSYTLSMYAKANTRNFIVINLFDNANRRAWFNLSTGTIGTTDSGVTAAIQSIGNGWYRCSILINPTVASTFPTFVVSNADNSYTYLGNGSGIYIYGAQLELSTTLGAYNATTTTAIFNSPNLSFASASSIGLQSDGSLYVQPAGTGAIQAQATTSSATGGNARGANAVDWQTSRGAANQVASGSLSAILSGASNRASGAESVVVAGDNNAATGVNAVIAGGAFHTASGLSSYIGGGVGSTASGNYTFIGSGDSNTAAGFYNFIGGGYTNSGTSASAVTTQSGTMNATTAVTLSGSNANIKVGQYIVGTSIASRTYVAAISGTSLTLSQAASGSSTSTLSFYTPHGVVVGGGNNQATGAYSFIGGGGDAGTAANRNTASGAWSTIAGGWKNLASGEAAFVGGGGSFGGGASGNTASATSSFVGAGFSNQANGYASTTVGGSTNITSNNYSFIGGGNNNAANANSASIAGGSYGTTRSIVGMQTIPACYFPIATAQGVSQGSILILARETTNATATVLTSDANAASGTNQVILPNNSAYFFRGEVISGVTGGGNTKGWTIEGVIKRGAGVGTTVLVGSTVTSMYADVGAATWTIGLTADTTNGGLAVTFTGQASTTIRTVCRINTTEMTY
jgi:hypothetical protein